MASERVGAAESRRRAAGSGRARSTPERRSSVNSAFTPQPRETWDRGKAIVRQINALAKSFERGDEDTTSLDYVRAIESATADLRARALEALGDQYSNAEIGDALGITRQAVAQERRRKAGVGAM